MAKRILNGSTALYPVPAALITCADGNGQQNIVTLAWVGTVCSDPPLVAIGINPKRHSHQLIKDSGEFVVNLPRASQVHETDYCGTRSGRDIDKFEGTGFTTAPASQVKAPLIAECPVALECKVRQTLSLGSHDVFIGEVVAVQADEDVLVGQRLDPGRLSPLAYVAGTYWTLGEPVGSHGVSREPAE